MINVCYTIDVLSDGSEFTGPTLFLSVWRKPKSGNNRNPTDDQHEWIREEMKMNPPLARYAIAGLGDATARLCADQRFKLAPTKAVFIPSLDCSDGLSALLLALLSSGSASLHVVSSCQLDIEELAGIMIGKNRHLNIQTCHIPKERQWWKVYSDKYIQAHARALSDPGKIVYLYTLLHFKVPESVDDECESSNASDETSKSESESDNGSENESERDTTRRQREYTFAVFPPGMKSIQEEINDVQHGNLPILESGIPMRLDHVIALEPTNSETGMSLPEASIPVFWTLPSTSLDTGLLIRSQELAKHFSDEMPVFFPLVESPREMPERESLPYSKVIDSNQHVLKSCTSVLFKQEGDTKASLVALDRRLDIWHRTVGEEWSTTLASLRSFVATEEDGRIERGPSEEDENEIDLDEESEMDENEIKLQDEGSDDGNWTHDLKDDKTKNDQNSAVAISFNKPQLVVLGTGCASPSALRGASGYALVLPRGEGEVGATDIFLVDCGEGVTTILNRTFNDMSWRNSIRGIWISHAHLDHYGGLPKLIRSVSDANADNVSYHSNRDEGKRRRLDSNRQKNIPWVMAPPKVLQYLDVLLGCKYGKETLNEGHNQLFSPLLHIGPSPPPGPWSCFQNIKVHHNCCPSYGLLLRLQGSSGSCLCFSGDTRPCSSLVAACRRHIPAHEKLLLVHEATFEDTDQDQAQKKKHSTVSEALSIASQVEASRVLLTHFSQRYLRISKEQIEKQRTTNNRGKVVPVGFAMDGLRFNF